MGYLILRVTGWELRETPAQMIDLIQEYLSGDFTGLYGRSTYNDVLWFMAWIVVATVVTGLILSLTTWWRERRHRAVRSDDSPETAQRKREAAIRVLNPDLRFSLRHLMSWHPPSVILLSVIGAASLWLGWHVVILPLAAATAVAYLWHFELRRLGVRWAAVYSLTSWMLHYLVVVATLALFRDALVVREDYLDPDRLTWWFHWYTVGFSWSYDVIYGSLVKLNPWVLAVVATWSICAVAASLRLAQSRHVPINPVLVAVASCPVALGYWFTNPWAIPLGAFTMVLLGHAMSRERRLCIESFRVFECDQRDAPVTRRIDERAIDWRMIPFVVMFALAAVAIFAVPDRNDIYYWFIDRSWHRDWHPAWGYALKTATLWVPLAALGAVGYVILRKVANPAQAAPFAATAILLVILSDALISGDRWIQHLEWSHLTWPPELTNHAPYGPRLTLPDVAGVPLALSYIIASLLLLAILWQTVRGKLANYGGLLFGTAWVVIVYWIFELSLDRQNTWRIDLSDFLLVNLVVAAVLMFATLHWGFGPGSVRTLTQRHLCPTSPKTSP